MKTPRRGKKKGTGDLGEGEGERTFQPSGTWPERLKVRKAMTEELKLVRGTQGKREKGGVTEGGWRKRETIASKGLRPVTVSRKGLQGPGELLRKKRFTKNFQTCAGGVGVQPRKKNKNLVKRKKPWGKRLGGNFRSWGRCWGGDTSWLGELEGAKDEGLRENKRVQWGENKGKNEIRSKKKV